MKNRFFLEFAWLDEENPLIVYTETAHYDTLGEALDGAAAAVEFAEVVKIWDELPDALTTLVLDWIRC